MSDKRPKNQLVVSNQLKKSAGERTASRHWHESRRIRAGVDGMTVEQLPAYLKEHWPTIREQLLRGTYQPPPVKRVEIPKPDGGMRKLGIPTVLDKAGGEFE